MHALTRNLRPLAIVALALLPLFATADEPEQRWYSVEVIVFAQSNERYRDSEVWPDAPPTEPSGNPPIALLPAPEKPPQAPDEAQPFQRLLPEEMQLGGYYQRLERSSQFEPLLYVGWRQPGLPMDNAQPVALQVPEASPDLPMDAAEPLEAEPDIAPTLSGSVTLKLGRYLHFETRLQYRLAAQVDETIDPVVVQPVFEKADAASGATAEYGAESYAEPAAPAQQLFLMNESRRMRSGELHYIDHPLFGVLVQVTPYDLPEPTPAAPQPDQPTGPQSGVIIR